MLLIGGEAYRGTFFYILYVHHVSVDVYSTFLASEADMESW